MARKKKIEETEEELLEVTEEFKIEDVSDTEILSEGLQDLDVTEVEAAIEVGEPIELVEEVGEPAEVKPKAAKKRKKPTEGKSPKIIPVKKIKPVESPVKNNGIRSTQGLFYR